MIRTLCLCSVKYQHYNGRESQNHNPLIAFFILAAEDGRIILFLNKCVDSNEAGALATFALNLHLRVQIHLALLLCFWFVCKNIFSSAFFRSTAMVRLRTKNNETHL